MFVPEVSDMSDDQLKECCEELSKKSKGYKAQLRAVINYSDGHDYADICEPEYLDDHQLSNQSFVKGYNSRRKEINKSEIPVLVKKR